MDLVATLISFSVYAVSFKNKSPCKFVAGGSECEIIITINYVEIDILFI